MKIIEAKRFGETLITENNSVEDVILYETENEYIQYMEPKKKARISSKIANKLGEFGPWFDCIVIERKDKKVDNKQKYLLEDDGLISEKPTLVVLNNIQKVDVDHPLYLLYSKHQDSPTVTKIQITILNSIITQRQMVFILTRKHMIDLLESDFNWKEKSKLNTRVYGYVLKMLMNTYLRKLVEGKGRAPSAYELTSSKIIDLISLTEDEAQIQYDTTLKIINNLNKIRK